MKIIQAKKIHEFEKELVEAMRGGALVIHPTDTIYGVGCNARNARAVKRVRVLKSRFTKPFSVIAPSREWIRENCMLSPQASDFLEKKMPGAYTIILRLRKKRCVCRATNAGLATLGVRLPRHWFTQVVRKAGVPFVTTSVNKSGGEPARTLRELTKFAVDYIVFDGAKRGQPSTILDFSGKSVSIKRRN